MFIVFSEWHSIYAFLGWHCIGEGVSDYLSLSVLDLIRDIQLMPSEEGRIMAEDVKNGPESRRGCKFSIFRMSKSANMDGKDMMSRP